MKLVVVAASLLALVEAARPAQACSPAPTCGDMYCSGPAAVIEAGVFNRQPDGLRVTVQITSVYGDAAELTPGSMITLDSDPYATSETDVGKSLYIYLERDQQGLRIQQRFDPQQLTYDDCFAADATAATVADAALSPSCYETLVPVAPPPPRCPEQIGFGCSATGGNASAFAAFALVGMVLRGRRRTRLTRGTGRSR